MAASCSLMCSSRVILGAKIGSSTAKQRQNIENIPCPADEEPADFRKNNERLHELTQKMHEKALMTYRNILQNEYDPEFDDDIMVEGRLRFDKAWMLLRKIL